MASISSGGLAKLLNPYQGLKRLILFMGDKTDSLAKLLNPYQGLKRGTHHRLQVSLRNLAKLLNPYQGLKHAIAA